MEKKHEFEPVHIRAKEIKGGKKSQPTQLSIEGHHNQVNGDGAQGNINGGTSIDVVVLEERIKSMQQLLEEKERTIKILMEKK